MPYLSTLFDDFAGEANAPSAQALIDAGLRDFKHTSVSYFLFCYRWILLIFSLGSEI